MALAFGFAVRGAIDGLKVGLKLGEVDGSKVGVKVERFEGGFVGVNDRFALGLADTLEVGVFVYL